MSALRVAYAGHDFLSSCLASIIRRSDVRLVLCLANPPDGPPVDNVVRLAHSNGAPVLFGKPSGELVDTINRAGIDLLIGATYMYRVPVEDLSVGRAVNVHPTLLPAGRGPNPLPYLISDRPDLFGVTVHEMTSEFDRGPILVREPLTLDAGEGLDEAYLKLFAAAPRVLCRLLDNLDGFLANKEEQQGGSYWPEFEEEQRVVVAAEASVADTLALHRKFGMLGTVVRLTDGTRIEVTQLSAARCEHSFPPGSVVARLRTGTIVALRDGMLRFPTPHG